MFKSMIPIAAIGMLMLAGCQENSSETAEEVADAREDAAQDFNAALEKANKAIDSAQRDVVDARQDLARTERNAADDFHEVEAEAMTRNAHANFDVAETEAENRTDVEMDRCDALEDAAKDLCISNAEMTLAIALATATSTRDTALLAAERLEE